MRSDRSAITSRSSTTTGHELPPARLRRPTGAFAERRRVRRRDRQHRGRRTVRGLLQQRRGQRADAAVRLVLDGRPRLPRRRPATCTSRAATPTGSASTARTSRPQPIEDDVRHAPGVVLAAVYGVPDDQAGDQVMAGLVLGRRRRVRPRRRSRHWLDAQPNDRPEVASPLRADPRATRRPPARTRS